MSHENLNRAKVSIIFKKMGSEAASKGMNRRRFCNTSFVFSHFKDMLNARSGYGLTFNKTREKQVSRSVKFPVESEHFKVFMGQNCKTILVAFAMINPD